MNEQREAPALLAEVMEGEAMDRERVRRAIRNGIGRLRMLQNYDRLLMLLDAALAPIQRVEESVEW